MASEAHVYAQLVPSGGVDTDLYTVTASLEGLLTVHWCNRSSVPARIRVAIRLAGAVLNSTHYRIYDKLLFPNGSENTLPLHLNAGDVITVRSDTSDVTFHCSGLEFTY